MGSPSWPAKDHASQRSLCRCSQRSRGRRQWPLLLPLLVLQPLFLPLLMLLQPLNGKPELTGITIFVDWRTVHLQRCPHKALQSPQIKVLLLLWPLLLCNHNKSTVRIKNSWIHLSIVSTIRKNPNYDVIILNKRQQQQVVKSCGFVCFFFKKKWCSNQLSQKRECHVQ